MTGAGAIILRVTGFAIVLMLAAIQLAEGSSARGAARHEEMAMEEFRIATFFEAEELEYRAGRGTDTVNWEVQGWIGGDYDKVWFKTEGDRVIDGSLQDAELQLLYSRMVTAFWDLQIGGRFDSKPEPSRGFAVIGLQGLAPYFFEIDAAAFVSDEGDVSARFEAEYDLLLTQRLILKPSIELNFAAREVEELGIGSGLSGLEAGLRLRYEVAREWAPYVGLVWERQVGRTADFARGAGEDAGALRWVSGLRVWF